MTELLGLVFFVFAMLVMTGRLTLPPVAVRLLAGRHPDEDETEAG